MKGVDRNNPYLLWVRYKTSLSRDYWKKHIFWSDGYYIGEVSSATIEKYILGQS